MQLLGCRAQLQATKQSFMLLSRTFTSWQQLVALRRRLEAVTDTLQASGTCTCTLCFSLTQLLCGGCLPDCD
jgi:hypothetical protein